MSYPVKYAAMPVVIMKDWTKGLRRFDDDIEVYYIISRCNVLSETKKYFSDGSSNITYKVSFPYLFTSTLFQNSDFYFQDESTRGFTVTEVYDENDYEVLKEKVDSKNKKILSRMIPRTDYIKEKIQNLQKNYEEMKQECDEQERLLEEMLKETMPFERIELKLKK